jgi:hypothetical protein
MLRYPLLFPHLMMPHNAALPATYPGEQEGRQMPRADYDHMRHWPTSEDFRRQCDNHQMNAWQRNFLADAHDTRMDHIAWHSGFHAAAVFDRMAAGLRERERARAREEAAAAAGRRKMWRSSMKMMTD